MKKPRSPKTRETKLLPADKLPQVRGGAIELNGFTGGWVNSVEFPTP
jgi:hypothetical protein